MSAAGLAVTPGARLPFFSFHAPAVQTPCFSTALPQVASCQHCSALLSTAPVGHVPANPHLIPTATGQGPL